MLCVNLKVNYSMYSVKINWYEYNEILSCWIQTTKMKRNSFIGLNILHRLFKKKTVQMIVKK